MIKSLTDAPPSPPTYAAPLYHTTRDTEAALNGSKRRRKKDAGTYCANEFKCTHEAWLISNKFHANGANMAK
eukprot:7589634-Pyramimonas_sp.AAC.1